MYRFQSLAWAALLAAGGFFASAAPALAQGHHSGGHSGNHGSVSHGSVSHGNISHGNVHHGGNWNHSSNWNHSGWGRDGYWYGRGGYLPYWYGRYGWPRSYYYGGYSYPYYSNYYDYYPSTTFYDDSYYPSSAVSPAVTSTEEVAPASSTRARIEVIVPDPDAQVWFQGQRTSRTGRMREFVSPTLNPGEAYTYNITAAWNENGRVMTQERQVTVRAGTMEIVDFTRPTANLRSIVPAP